ncbi:hypothetical protein NDU88_004879 [Pleurodeles waltl]|uniref:Uncharacterized protein n=1 Tax=Pleurodeles waltl TaxID=8319 RepID=A0AAV7PG77_PLEWA|nr:hypothetical protein NDU88_004879 [Pleurodeles waltl]
MLPLDLPSDPVKESLLLGARSGTPQSLAIERRLCARRLGAANDFLCRSERHAGLSLCDKASVTVTFTGVLRGLRASVLSSKGDKAHRDPKNPKHQWRSALASSMRSLRLGLSVSPPQQVPRRTADSKLPSPPQPPVLCPL